MSINGADIMWSDKIKYHGSNITSEVKFTIDLAETRRKFLVSVNTILSKWKYSTDIVNLKQSYFQSILLYGLDYLNLRVTQIKEINGSWNLIYRNIFDYNQWENIKEVICQMRHLDIHHLVNMCRFLFIKRIN